MTGRKPKANDPGLWDRVKKTVDPLDAKQRARYSQALADYLETGSVSSSHETAPHPVQPAKGALKRHPPRNAGVQPSNHRAGPPRTQAPTVPGRANHAVASHPPLVDLDRKARSRIARGRTPIDARLDLHGLRQHEAHDVLRAFIWRAHASGHRTVLVITGKGSRVRDPHPDAPPWAVGSGILRKAVPGWLAAPDLRSAVLGVEPAHASHGGDGALYVRLRAKKTKP